ncbi:hypothetical protein E0I74_12260 [Rhizobium laguerreae]|uniref:hypothetical protein n=1 Tax=Rhizobium laguerreae TaxID=1076926 RepID=UPI00103E2D9D|nr:hypothetical protein [Rhizobium laguerreae]MBY3140762.1 hypothetical protein [Rhizobium laguerreae]MBY3158102.1 hypothetical protein [Rhizobium laguerreae]MBY3203658.1 hypothetical protein [Rhizobium laguerreae]MBY3264781.1 hypothetical protein [Rhizobium laguerreae]MBY3273413.1 hypothetical protein [Rhizobium laguerreae]
MPFFRFRNAYRTVAILASAMLLLAPAASGAACLICDEVVELDGVRANCFRQDYEKFLSTARSSETSNTEVDLSACAGDDGRERRGLDRMPGLLSLGSESSARNQRELRSVYIFDEASLVCLKRLLDGHEGKIDPSVRFDLVENCKP